MNAPRWRNRFKHGDVFLFTFFCLFSHRTRGEGVNCVEESHSVKCIWVCLKPISTVKGKKKILFGLGFGGMEAHSRHKKKKTD